MATHILWFHEKKKSSDVSFLEVHAQRNLYLKNGRRKKEEEKR